MSKGLQVVILSMNLDTEEANLSGVRGIAKEMLKRGLWVLLWKALNTG